MTGPTSPAGHGVTQLAGGTIYEPPWVLFSGENGHAVGLASTGAATFAFERDYPDRFWPYEASMSVFTPGVWSAFRVYGYAAGAYALIGSAGFSGHAASAALVGGAYEKLKFEADCTGSADGRMARIDISGIYLARP
jgi:hypothetical protein